MKIVKPFGPEIGIFKLDDVFLRKLTESCEVDMSTPSVISMSVGLLQNQYSVISKIRDYFPVLNKYVIEYLQSCNSVYQGMTFDERDIQCVQAWVNDSKQNEFYPAHNHPLNELVCLTFLKVDLSEKSEFDTKGKVHNGSIVFYHGDLPSGFGNSAFHYLPSTGDVLIFPASLLHSTYPIIGNNVRISLACNYNFTQYFEMKKRF
jgi:hypothetical protein